MKLKTHILLIIFIGLVLTAVITCEKKPAEPEHNHPFENADPFDLRATIANGGITLSWNKRDWQLLTGYRLFKSVDDSLHFGAIVERGANDTTCIDTENILNGHTYWYYIEAIVSGGNPQFSRVAYISIPFYPVLEINGGDDSTCFRTVSLTILASGADSILLSNQSDFINGLWETYQTGKSWELSDGFGSKEVWLKARYPNGSISTPVSDMINYFENFPPNPPSNPTPADSASNISINADISWTCSDANNDPLSYDVYFGTSADPPLVSQGQNATTYDPGTMNDYTRYCWKIVAHDNYEHQTVGAIWAFTTIANQPPNAPSNPNPPVSAGDVPINANLSWSCSDPNNDPLNYDVYFGTSADPPLVSQGQTATTYDPGTLSYITHYYWKIVAHDNYEHQTVGALWGFTTSANQPPNAPSNPNPGDGVSQVSIDADLSWSCSDPDNDPLTYDVYFGTSADPPLVSQGQTATTYNPGTLSYITRYYWKIVARDNYEHQTNGAIWDFTTRLSSGIYFVGSCDIPGDAYGVYVSENYAYVAGGTYTLNIINVADPANPSKVGGYNATIGFAFKVFVDGNYAYVAHGDYGLLILDIANVADPNYVAAFDLTGSSEDIFIYEDFAYVAGNTQGLQIIYIYNPASPILTGGYNTTGYAKGVFVQGNYAYVGDGSYGLQIIDVLNPSEPIKKGGYNTLGNARGVFVVGNLAYVADGTTGLQIIDVTNPSGPTLVGSCVLSDFAYDVWVSGNYAYVADDYSGLQIVDISNPSNPTLAGSYNTAGRSTDVYVLGDYIYLADGNEGLLILQFVP